METNSRQMSLVGTSSTVNTTATCDVVYKHTRTRRGEEVEPVELQTRVEHLPSVLVPSMRLVLNTSLRGSAVNVLCIKHWVSPIFLFLLMLLIRYIRPSLEDYKTFIVRATIRIKRRKVEWVPSQPVLWTVFYHQ